VKCRSSGAWHPSSLAPERTAGWPAHPHGLDF
jgi:hypothetical protein